VALGLALGLGNAGSAEDASAAVIGGSPAFAEVGAKVARGGAEPAAAAD
jgi:hypothetical protein